MVLSFSADGSDDFGKRDMKEQSPGNWMGEIPSSATEGAKVSYYIEAVGDDDQVLARKGSATEPLVVSLRGPGGAALVPPKKKPAQPRPKNRRRPARPGSSRWAWAAASAGRPGTGEVNGADQVKPGRVRLGAPGAGGSRGRLLRQSEPDRLVAVPAAARDRRDRVPFGDPGRVPRHGLQPGELRGVRICARRLALRLGRAAPVRRRDAGRRHHPAHHVLPVRAPLRRRHAHAPASTPSRPGRSSWAERAASSTT